MKRLLKVITWLFITGLPWIPQKALLGSPPDNGVFGGPVCKTGEIYNKTALIIGGRIGWVINHQFVLGGGGYALLTQISSSLDPSHKMNMGYGGFEIEYIRHPNKITHFSVMALFGGGGTGFSERDGEHWESKQKTDTFYIFEPSMHLVLNITAFFRFGVGASYRVVRAINTSQELTNGDLSGPSLIMTCKFGNF